MHYIVVFIILNDYASYFISIRKIQYTGNYIMRSLMICTSHPILFE